MVSSQRRKLLLALGASLTVAACGKKGDLELPPIEPVPADEPSGGDAQ
ncbi:MAG: lipoprotein [Pseudomonadota bacterium]